MVTPFLFLSSTLLLSYIYQRLFRENWTIIERFGSSVHFGLCEVVTPFLFKLLRIINLPTPIYGCFLCCHCLPFSNTLPIIPILGTPPIFMLVIVIVFEHYLSKKAQAHLCQPCNSWFRINDWTSPSLIWIFLAICVQKGSRSLNQTPTYGSV